ncbi:MAG: ribosome-binding factor A [Candidatus Buchananbacteria bacterium RIFCSPHIGHO2_02_FULL_38_8]|uniref:Ribosome-binding factor A n=2 Tax=Candidatus Buchananiibacteriota TaxID=1817903 RepID=A0A1G1XVJ3_9BACT|nr:MAG: ribosome-binding factor A [Candidatus Buchananbacteria bacterium RIFCSPHIGHO2_01_FULL_39_8]OGY46984.1 MAG: ribosome-binding factor A [Candidatus Buchananbacteria bacterium RIFCSPHIGHO2_02_FULL_38_8]
MSHRIAQINEIIKYEVNNLLLTEIDWPKGCLVTITSVGTSKDLRYTKIWISVIPDIFTQKVLDILKKNIGHLQFLLNKKLSTKPLPRLNFAIDETEKKAAEIEKLLNEIT